MTRSPNKSCGYCGQSLHDSRARFEVRVAPDYQLREGEVVGTFCAANCWEAAKARKSVETTMKRLHSDMETVLGDAEKILRRP